MAMDWDDLIREVGALAEYARRQRAAQEARYPSGG
ncbi:hypothetical protein M2352_004340 [Azospirillum fermentarium]|nr:hypothetical protein [Azospirillum fermentarium]